MLLEPPRRPRNARGSGHYVCRTCRRVARDNGEPCGRAVLCRRCWLKTAPAAFHQERTADAAALRPTSFDQDTMA